MNARQKQIWLTEFQLNGFVVLPRFLPLEFVEAMRDELLPLLESEQAKAEQNDWGQGRARGRLSLHIAPYADMLKGALADARYRANPVIEDLVDTILGQGQWKRGWTVVEAVWRGAAHMSWHSDQKLEETPDIDAPHQPLRLTDNIPRVDFTRTVIAIERHRRENGRPPAALADLVPRELPELPVDPVTGRDFRYETDGIGWRVRSEADVSSMASANLPDPVLDWARPWEKLAADR